MESLDAVPIVSPSVRRNHVTCWTACYPKARGLDSPPPSLRLVECCAPSQLSLRFLWGQDGWSGPTSVCRMILSLTNAFKTCSLCLTSESHSGGRSLTSRFYRDWWQAVRLGQHPTTSPVRDPRPPPHAKVSTTQVDEIRNITPHLQPSPLLCLIASALILGGIIGCCSDRLTLCAM